MSESNALVIFGSTGDLAYSKLLPALAECLKTDPRLAIQKVFLIGRSAKNLQEYLSLGQEKGLDIETIVSLQPRLEFVFMQATETKDYSTLAKLLSPFNGRYFYVATPPTMFAIILESLAREKIFSKSVASHRIAFEKPFGENLTSAQVLNGLLHQWASESQIFRVDHYLAKPLIKDLLQMRSAWKNVERYLRSPHVVSIDIKAYETLGILSRGKFYDATGALRDMVQSHLLQTLTLAAMDNPNALTPKAIAEQKIKFLKSLSPSRAPVLWGQYEGYRSEVNVDPHSLTETFVHLGLTSTLPRWKDVKMTLSTGKKLSEKKTEIVYTFSNGSRMVLNVSPLAKIKLEGAVQDVIRDPIALQSLAVLKQKVFDKSEAYVQIFAKFILGDAAYFPSAEELELTWQLCDALKKKATLPIPYRTEADILKEATHG